MAVICAFHHFCKECLNVARFWMFKNIWVFTTLERIIRFKNWVLLVFFALGIFQHWAGLSLPLDLLLVENCLGSELPISERRDLFSSVSRDDDASFQIAEAEIALIHLLRRWGMMFGRRAVGETGITFAQRADCLIVVERQNRAGNGELRGRRGGRLQVSS